ncbi:hypothetical protein B0H19DRAFT_1199737 [Mycena capillaripes]|nr:hypothetical protein B0H19DRAFT_1199737 [Mycena capillaripes]
MSTVLAFVFLRRHFLRFIFPHQRHLADRCHFCCLYPPHTYVSSILPRASHPAYHIRISPPSYIDMWSRTLYSLLHP